MPLRQFAHAGCFTLAALMAPAAHAAGCASPDAYSARVAGLHPSLSAIVVGQGRLQYYSEPDWRCPIKDLFVIPKDDMIVYAMTSDGWSEVVFVHAKNSPLSWVRSSRLKLGGAMGPTQ
jgi:hypothetical protein